jgi:pSer/pThr/pTyr-binding forkhead associated (FHA) protein
MDIVLTAIVGLIASVMTAYVTYRLTTRQEKRRHERDIAVRLAEIPSTRDDATRIMAVQFAEGVLVIEREGESDRHRVFLPAGSRVTLGRGQENHIVIDKPSVSRTHAAFRSSDGTTFVEPLGANTPIMVNGSEISKPKQLRQGDVITLSDVQDVSVTFVEITR